MEALAYGLENKEANIYLFRETYDDLEANLIKEWKDKVPKELQSRPFNNSKHYATLINGTVIKFRYIRSLEDAESYQGRSMDFIGIDELTKMQKKWVMILLSCLRSAKGFPVRFRGTCNPGSRGHGYVRGEYVHKTDYGKNIVKCELTGNTQEFIPATVYDNDVLMQNDPNYVKRLENLPEKEKQAFLYGNWDIFEGQYFEEFADKPAHYLDRRWTHVIAGFNIPEHWKIFRSFDFGYAKPFSNGWWAMDGDGRLYRILEAYGCTKEPNTGLKWEPNKIFAKIKEIEDTHIWLKEKHIIGIADPSIWDSSRGDSIADTAEKHRVYFEPGDNKRLPGWMQMRYRFAFDENGIPMMYIFDNCVDTIRTLPELIYDDKDVEDLDTDGEDHCLIGSTLINTKDGLIQIRDLVDTEGLVYSHDGKLHKYYDCRKTQENVDVYTIELEDGRKVTATKNHRFMLEDETWKRIDELLESDCIKTIIIV